ncbi:glycosyltransferase [Candidatus Woesearchaeota archaeon]|nr:glycosyltransferase [Candidatus Woesearchaeota archaeon]
MLLDHLQSADILIGIPSYNEADSLGHVVEQVDQGLSKHFPGRTCVIANIDNSPGEETREAFLKVRTRNGKLHIRASDLGLGKGGNIRILLELADRFNAPAIAMVDSDLSSITPEWVRDLVTPILRGFDIVTPLYSRNHLDGTITNTIVYPLVYGLLGKGIRQPIAGEFGFSLRLARSLLAQEWEESTYHFGIDSFMTVHALIGGFRPCQTKLGAKVHKPSAPKLDRMFSQVVSTLFSIIATHAENLKVADPEEVATFGTRLEPPQPLGVDLARMRSVMETHWREQRSYLEMLLEPHRFRELDAAFAQQKVMISENLWAELVYGILAYFTLHTDPEVRARAVECLKPLYFARVLTYALQTRELDEAHAESLIVRQAETFRAQRWYFFDHIKARTGPQEAAQRRRKELA